MLHSPLQRRIKRRESGKGFINFLVQIFHLFVFAIHLCESYRREFPLFSENSFNPGCSCVDSSLPFCVCDVYPSYAKDREWWYHLPQARTNLVLQFLGKDTFQTQDLGLNTDYVHFYIFLFFKVHLVQFLTLTIPRKDGVLCCLVKRGECTSYPE